jgi:F-box/TPR repeat protein Pof3
VSHSNECQAISVGPPNFVTYEYRSSAYERLGNLKKAISDAKKVIELAPTRWHGYAHSARLFLKIRQYDSSLAMLDFALERIGNEDMHKLRNIDSLRTRVLREKEMDSLNRRRNLRGLVCHFGTLPVELVVQIFEEILSSEPLRAVTLSHVCRRWRTIALSTPALWRMLVISSKSPVTKVKTWNERSRGDIWTLHARYTARDKVIDACRHLRPRTFSNLRVLVLEGSEDFLKHFGTHFLKLQELRIAHDTSNFRAVSQLKHVPLRTLGLRNTCVSWALIAQTFTTLTCLDVRECNNMDSSCLLRTMEANPLLETVISDRVSTRFVTESATTVSSFEFLSSFAIDLRSVRIGSLQEISFPSLQSLSLSYGSNIDTLIEALRNRGINLTEFRISRCPVSPSALINFLRNMPLLRTIEISSVTNTANMVVEALASSVASSSEDADIRSQTFICPALTHLDFSYCDDVMTGPLIRLVKSRLFTLTTTHAPITSLIVDGCTHIDVDALPWFRSKVASFSCIYGSKS